MVGLGYQFIRSEVLHSVSGTRPRRASYCFLFPKAESVLFFLELFGLIWAEVAIIASSAYVCRPGYGYGCGCVLSSI